MKNSINYSPSLNYGINTKDNYLNKIKKKANYPWEVPDEIYKAIPNDKEIELTILCDTYNTDGSLVGSDETTMWARVNEGQCRPTLSVSIQNDGLNRTHIFLFHFELVFLPVYF